MDDISLEEKLAALEGLSGKSGNKPLNLAEIRRGVESVISEKRASEMHTDHFSRRPGPGVPSASVAEGAIRSRPPVMPTGHDATTTRMAPMVMPGQVQARSRAMTEAPGGSSSGPSRMGRAKQQSTAVTSSPLQPTVPRTARATVAFTAGTNEGSSDRSKSGTKPLQKQKSLASTSKEGSLSYVHTLKEGERKGGWIKISGPPFLVKEADVLSLQEVFNDIQGAAGEGVVTLQAFRRYVGSKVSSGKDDSRERAKQLSADLYRVLDTQGKDSVDFIDIVRVMHPELSKKDLAIVCAAVMPLRDVRVLDEMERRDITRTFQEKTFKSEGRLPLYQVLAIVRDRISPSKMSKINALVHRQGFTDSDDVTLEDFFAMVAKEEERLLEIEAAISPEERLARHMAERAARSGISHVIQEEDKMKSGQQNSRDVGSILQQYAERRARAETQRM